MRTAAKIKYHQGPERPNMVPIRAAAAPSADISKANPNTNVRE
jgi:hypothetical protein